MACINGHHLAQHGPLGPLHCAPRADAQGTLQPGGGKREAENTTDPARDARAVDLSGCSGKSRKCSFHV